MAEKEDSDAGGSESGSGAAAPVAKAATPAPVAASSTTSTPVNPNLSASQFGSTSAGMNLAGGLAVMDPTDPAKRLGLDNSAVV